MKREKQNHMKPTCSLEPNRITKTYQALEAHEPVEANRESEIERRGEGFEPKRNGWGEVWREKSKHVSKVFSSGWICVCVYRVLFIFKDKYCFFLLKIRIGFLERKIVFLILFFKYCANMKNCGSFRCFYYIYIYICKDQLWLEPRTRMDPGPISPNNKFIESGRIS